MPGTSRHSVSRALRVALLSDPRTIHRIARDAGVSHTMLSRFANGRRGLTTATLDRVCRAMSLGLERAA